MIVCHCSRVSDRQIRSCMQEGARSVADVARSCGAGAGCGGCRPEIAEILSAGREGTLESRSVLRVLRTG